MLSGRLAGKELMMNSKDVLELSGRLLTLAGTLPPPRFGVAALAFALGRACVAAGVNLDTAFVLAHVGHDAVDPRVRAATRLAANVDKGCEG